MAHVSMGINKMSRNEWIRIDRGYMDRIRERQMVMREHAADAIGTSDLVNPAIAELYEEIMIKHLPHRFPTMFRIEGARLLNLVTGKSHSINIQELSHSEMLQNLGESVEEDFYIMCPDEEGEIRLQGYIACFPGGFLSLARVGMSMRDIHQPVPGYAERIAKGADRHLQRLSPGNFIERMNWSLQVDGPDLFRLDGNNYYPEQGEEIPEDEEAIDISASYLRVEHQTLNRLPKTQAVIFCVRSYLTPLEDIKKEGNGPALLGAIKSMPEKLGDYKKRPFWCKTVYDYLGA
ncbi:hrq family 2 [Trichoderma arundinaceum]|uniref:Hrq family 2 n=1 Tax=Trichoderma arundinaceum TaxID=490622 RepID=A0A395NBR2_TRIAR|nr:hrq family 2 [Trichoderma arundinaceum]